MFTTTWQRWHSGLVKIVTSSMVYRLPDVHTILPFSVQGILSVLNQAPVGAFLLTCDAVEC